MELFKRMCSLCGGSGVVDVDEEKNEAAICGECEYDGVTTGMVLTEEGQELLAFLMRLKKVEENTQQKILWRK